MSLNGQSGIPLVKGIPHNFADTENVLMVARWEGVGGWKSKWKGLRRTDHQLQKQSQGYKVQCREHSQCNCNNNVSCRMGTRLSEVTSP